MSNKSSVMVTERNFVSVAKRLKEQGGSILLVRPSSFNREKDVTIDLFASPKLIPKGRWLEAGCTKTSNRAYLLRPIPEPTGNQSWDLARTLFQELILEERYQFKISMQSMTCLGPIGREGVVIYVPSPEAMAGALVRAFTWAIERINLTLYERGDPFRLKDDNVPLLVEYTMRDLKTGEVVRHNTQAGMEADVLTGL